MAVYGSFLTQMVRNSIQGRVWRAALLATTYQQDIDSDAVWAHIRPYEISAAGYTPGGVSVSPEVVYDSANNRTIVSTDDISFGVLTATDVGALVVYAWTGDPVTSQLLAVDIFASAAAADGAEFLYSAPNDGLVSFPILEPANII